MNLFKPNEFGKFDSKQFGTLHQTFYIWLRGVRTPLRYCSLVFT